MSKKHTYCILIFLFVLLLGNVKLTNAEICDATHPKFDRWELVKILKQDGFSNVIDEYMELNRLGNIRVAESCFTFFVYSREFQSGSNLHQAKRLMVFRNYRYLGMYVIDELPIRVKGNTVEFPGKAEEGNIIVFNSDMPPGKIYVDGEVRSLFK